MAASSQLTCIACQQVAPLVYILASRIDGIPLADWLGQPPMPYRRPALCAQCLRAWQADPRWAPLLAGGHTRAS